MVLQVAQAQAVLVLERLIYRVPVQVLAAVAGDIMAAAAAG
jgi:hypothetical protein